jgi:serine/threonine protein kinase
MRGAPATNPPSGSTDENEMPDALNLPPLPERIGRYKLLRRLGNGNFGTVFLAEDELMRRQVAIKVPRLLATADANEQFLREARIVSQLKHEGIARAYDFGRDDNGSCFIVYEYIEGMNLSDRQKQAPISAEDSAAIVASVGEALHHAHLSGLVHRDVKPSNILLDGQDSPHVVDFGLAVREEDLSSQRGILAGTGPYMSPEQIRRGDHIDGRSDIYSLGVVLYELLTERRPFHGQTFEELADQILHREAKPLRQIKDTIPQSLEGICLKALAKSQSDRYNTSKDMADDLRVYLRGPPERDRQSQSSANSIAELITLLEFRAESVLREMEVIKQRARVLFLKDGTPGRDCQFDSIEDPVLRNLFRVLDSAPRDWQFSSEEALCSELDDLKQYFLELHNRHKEELRAGNYVVAHELVGKIHFAIHKYQHIAGPPLTGMEVAYCRDVILEQILDYERYPGFASAELALMLPKELPYYYRLVDRDSARSTFVTRLRSYLGTERAPG